MFATKTLRKWAILLAPTLALLAFLLIPPAQSQDKDTGVIVSGDRATLKAGFQFNRRAENEVQVRKHNADTAGGTTTVLLSCSCTKAAKDAQDPVCSVQILSNGTAQCGKKNGCTECKMDAVLPPK